MRTLLLVALILMMQSLVAYTWIPYGDFSEPIYNIGFYLEDLGIIAVSSEDTLYIQQEGIWQAADTHRLTVWDTERYDEDQLLLVMGGYSMSDGLYMLYLNDLQDNVIEWMQLPRFIHYNEYDHRYYLGASPGIGLSPDAYTWTGIPAFGQAAYFRLAHYGNHYVITTSNGVYRKEFTNPPVFTGQPDPPEIENDELDEISGIAASIRNTGIIWAINDSGGENAVYGFNMSGEQVATLYLQGVENRDWEDIAMKRSTQEIFVADIGDNNNIYETKYLHYFVEPYLDEDEIPIEQTVNVSTISFQYPDGNHDSETVMIDPQYNGIYFVTKRRSETQGGEDLVFKLPYPQSTEEVIMAEEVGSITVPAWFNPWDELYYGATAGDISNVGDEMLIKTYDSIYYWKKQPGQIIDDLFQEEPETVAYIQEPQGEALCWSKYGSDYYTTSEEPASYLPAVLRVYKRNDWTAAVDSVEIIDISFDSSGRCYGRSNAQDSVSYLYVSDDLGENWEVLAESPFGYLGALVVDSQDNVIAGWRGYNGEPSGVALWNDVLQEFVFMNEGIEGRSINRLLPFPLLEISSVIACTDSGAYFLTDYTEFEESEIIPPCINLKSFPNPAIMKSAADRNDPLTTIQFEISLEEQVQVGVYNLKGQKVKTLLDKRLPAGKHQTGWNGRDKAGRRVSSGIYFCRVMIQGKSSFTKMVVLRT